MTDSRAAEPRTGRPSTDSPRSDQPDQPAIKSGAGMLAAAPKEPATQDIGVPIRPFQSNPSAVASGALSFPDVGGPTRAALATDLVTCPECGQMATVDMARRQAEDFCTNCDYPLFWARGTVIAPSGQDTGASLRRLPGTVGRAATASLLCPHCGEPNSPTAEICVRCALSMHPVEVPEPARPPSSCRSPSRNPSPSRNRASPAGGRCSSRFASSSSG